MLQTKWSEADFDAMSWHDNHVHGLAIREGRHGTGELELDIDYILEWIRVGNGRFQFRIAPARLCFREVFNLKIALDYEVATAALGPFSIAAIERTLQPRQRWSILLNWPQGQVNFEANGFSQEIVGAEILSDGQCLKPAQRQRSG